ncbi:WD40-repeat-containing domain protein [Stachybotrys elegans]|uniref:WD40-repeat-containing domain protein n=1 Tax=Stachybotrys elegans TaxID=80388 RepID=A0A8K0SNF2_9HYPO|nr:WD40-repeat-containing domain protein [Stachybotrys elegans]
MQRQEGENIGWTLGVESASPIASTGASSTGGSNPYFVSAQWSADGTTLIAHSSHQTISSLVLPADLLQSDRSSVRPLEPQASFTLPEPTQAVAVAPFFHLSEPSSQTVLVGCRDLPLQLYHAFPEEGHASPLAGYKLIRKETEQYITPSSLLWQYPGTHFVCGSADRLDMFDVSRYGSDGPVLTIPTIPSRRHISKGSGVGMKGTVSALSASPEGSNGESIIAAGTRTRWMGLYDLNRSDKVVANWDIAPAEKTFDLELGGRGIVQVAWSPCGRYLLINERHAKGLLVYDIRGTGQALSVLKGRLATTQQRLTCDVFPGDEYGGGGFETWAGTQDGSVLVWENVGMQQGSCEPSWSWKAHDSPIGSTLIHSSGSVAATCSGGWTHSSGSEEESAAESTSGIKVLAESSLKVWAVNASEE